MPELCHPRLNTIDVVEIKPLADHRLWLRFSDGAIRIFDVKPNLNRGTVFQPLKDKAVFDGVYLDFGTATWQNGTIDIAPETLYHKGVPIDA